MNAPLRHRAATRFQVRVGLIDGFDAVELVDRRGGARALFARRGATLLDWKVPVAGGMLALTDGYASPAELADQNGVRNGVLAPFPNRIADGRFAFAGRDQDLLPGVAEGRRLIYHGFLREMDMDVAEVREGEAEAAVVFTTRIRPEDFPGYPYALDLRVEVSLHASGIALIQSATNRGAEAAPYAGGWHPYLRLGNADLARLELTVPASLAIVTDAALIPLAGEAAYAPLGSLPTLDLRRPRPIGSQVLDGCYADLQACADGLIRSRLRDPVTGHRLTVWQRGGFTHLFTGDTLARDVRRSIAIEPVEVMTNAFNRPESAEAISLAPGATRSFTYGAEFAPGALPSTPFAATAA
jgi:aldose 1-epimerase